MKAITTLLRAKYTFLDGFPRYYPVLLRQRYALRVNSTFELRSHYDYTTMRSRYNTTSYDCVPMKLRAKRSYHASTPLLPRLSRLRCVLFATLSRSIDVLHTWVISWRPSALSFLVSKRKHIFNEQSSCSQSCAIARPTCHPSNSDGNDLVEEANA